jgi:hypothetical protein
MILSDIFLPWRVWGGVFARPFIFIPLKHSPSHSTLPLPLPPLTGQAPAVSCQAGLVNLTKLQQLDLGWNPEKCSGDLKLSGPTVSKVAEVYGDYSTVLASHGELLGHGD